MQKSPHIADSVVVTRECITVFVSWDLNSGTSTVGPQQWDLYTGKKSTSNSSTALLLTGEKDGVIIYGVGCGVTTTFAVGSGSAGWWSGFK